MTESFDAIVAGYGWAGALVADQLAGAGYSVLVLERGEATPPSASGWYDREPERDGRRWRWQRTARDTVTLRHTPARRALPLRTLEVFGSGEGTGGSGVLWGGTSTRFHPDAFRPATVHGGRVREPANFDLLDWAVGYDQLEPYYARFEGILGVGGEPDPHPFAGWRSGPLPCAPPKDDDGLRLVRSAAAELGYHPHTVPAALLDADHVNTLGVGRSPDPLRGTSIATPLNTVHPHAERTGRVTIRTGAKVRRVTHDGGHARGILYSTPAGDRSAAAEVVVLATWTLQNTRLLLLSGIGEPYDHEAGTGVVGRGYAGHLSIPTTGYFDRQLSLPRAQASIGFVDSEPAGDSVGGAFHMTPSLGPLDPWESLTVPSETPAWGAGWKDALVARHGTKLSDVAISEALPSPRRFLDLDPRYVDADGDPLLRITFDWTENERRLVDRHGAVSRRVLAAAGASLMETTAPAFPYDVTRYQNTHLVGGARLGDDPGHSVVDPWLRSWQLRNVWVVGASAFPSASAPPPTLTAGALALRAADDIVAYLSGRPR